MHPIISQILQSIFGGHNNDKPTDANQSFQQPGQPTPSPAPLPNGGAQDMRQLQGDRISFINDTMRNQLMHKGATKLDIAGNPVDASAPTGIDWLKHNNSEGHSWDRTYNNGSGRTFSDEPQQPNPHFVFEGNKGRTVTDGMGHPVGYSEDATPGEPKFDLGNIFRNTNAMVNGHMVNGAPTNPMEAHTGPFLPAEQALLQQNIQAAGRQTFMDPTMNRVLPNSQGGYPFNSYAQKPQGNQAQSAFQ